MFFCIVFKIDDDDLPATIKSSSVESVHQQSLSSASTPTQGGPGTPVQLRTASIKSRPTSSRITAAELVELFQRQTGKCFMAHKCRFFICLLFIQIFNLVKFS